MAHEFAVTPIIGQEALCPDGLGRVCAFSDDFPKQWIQVDTYKDNRSCKWAPGNVQLVPLPALVSTLPVAVPVVAGAPAALGSLAPLESDFDFSATRAGEAAHAAVHALVIGWAAQNEVDADRRALLGTMLADIDRTLDELLRFKSTVAKLLPPSPRAPTPRP